MTLMDAAREVAGSLRRDGYEAYVAGGAVRDHLLGREPHDVDIATSAPPDLVAKRFPHAKLVGASFGVVVVPTDAGPIEVATFRREGPYFDGRRPSSVEFATAEEDVRRRDFTINGLFLDPDSLEVIDHTTGRADLDAGIIRAIGDAERRFEEDHLRLLRGVRFAAQLGFELAPETARAMKAHASQVARVAVERVRDELERLLTGRNARRGLLLLHELDILRFVLPEVAALEGVEQSPDYHPEGDVFVHTLLLFEHLEHPSVSVAFGALFHDIGKAVTFERAEDRIRFPRHAKVGAGMTEDICRRLKFSNERREQIVSLVANHMRFIDVTKMRLSTLKRFLRLPDFEEHLALHRADCLSSHRRLDNWTYAREKRAELGEEALRPKPLVTGHDLKSLGYDEGPALGDMLRRLEELQLGGKIATREEGLAIARRDLARLD